MNKVVQNIIGLVIFVIVASSFMQMQGSSYEDMERAETYDHYVDAFGNRASLDSYQGRYLWVDYAAEWCSYCTPQTKTLKTLDQRYGDRLNFITVVAGTSEVMEPPSAEDALAWADKFDLPHDKVLAYFSTNTLPYHILYAPDGEVLFRGSGLYSAEKITNIIRAKTSAL